MSKVPVSRLLRDIDVREREKRKRNERAQQQVSSLTEKEALSNKDKQEIAEVITDTTTKVAELIELLTWMEKSPQGEDYYYQTRWWYSQAQLKKIRPLKKKVSSWYFAIWEQLRIHDIGSEKNIQDYYARIKHFRQHYHATWLNSGEVRRFHEEIQRMLVPIINKAFKKK